MTFKTVKSNKIVAFGLLIILLSACTGTSLDLPTPAAEQLPATETAAVPDKQSEPPATSGQALATAEQKGSALQTPEEAAPSRSPASKYEDLELITLLPPDAIPAIDDPQFLSAAEADEFYDPDELVMGVTFNGDTRAYSIPLLSNHEIVNDTVGGVKIAVTW
jgi:hypothetical protein